MDLIDRHQMDRYLDRIGLAPPPAATLATLTGLQRAHLAAIPFENLDPRLGRPVRLDIESLVGKLVADRRGGYCFEQNTLFAAVLRTCGFEVSTLEARVRPPGATSPLPRTHMVLEVTTEGSDWLVDVGFGGSGAALPVPFDGAEIDDGLSPVRLVEEGPGSWVLQRSGEDGFADLYAFRRVPALPVDFEVANHYVSTHPQSIFVTTLTVQRNLGATRHIIRGRTHTRLGVDPEVVEGLSDDQIAELLRDPFGLPVDPHSLTQALAGI